MDGAQPRPVVRRHNDGSRLFKYNCHVGWARQSRDGIMESYTCRRGGPPPRALGFSADEAY